MATIDLSTCRVFLAPPGLARDLKQEVQFFGGTVVAERDELLITENFTPNPYWCRTEWREPRWLTVRSIGDAAKQLQGLTKNWALFSTKLHRRAKLIQEQLPNRKQLLLEFLAPIPKTTWGAWTLWEENLVLAAPSTRSPFPLGSFEFNEDKLSAPSRAYLKLWEILTLHGVRPRSGERCVDFGASPGGWTWVLAGLGCSVIAIDRAPLSPKVSSMAGVEPLEQNAFAFQPREGIDWFFSDLICYPEKLFDYLAGWRRLSKPPNFVCTLKFQGLPDFSTIQKFQAIPGARIVHLVHNKHELTWIASQER